MTRVIKLEAKGFKSFANKTELVFGDGFNCIIGPNGSGKSNVVDAICFVLGKGSAKGLRAEKSANLIYNGGKSKTPAKDGEVSLYFDNVKREFPVDEDVVKVTRVVKQNGSSVYKINDQAHTRNELLDLLARANIDPDGYNIILQGDIAHLIEMSGVERRQVIEEMAGIGIYEDKKQKALKELEKVQQGINEGSIILTERSTYLKELKHERDQALRFKELESRLKQAKRTLVVVSKELKETQLKELDQKGQERKIKIEELQQKINGLKQDIETFKQQVVDINKEIEEKGEAEQIKLHKHIEDLKVAIATDSYKLTTTDTEIERTKQRITGLQTSLQDLKDKSKQSSEQQKTLVSDIDSKEKQIAELQEKVSGLKQKYNLEGASAIEQRIEEIDKQADDLQKSIAQKRESMQDDLREKDRLEVQIEHMDQKIAKVQELEKENKSELDKLKQKRVEFKKATVELSQALSSNTTILSKLSTARQRYQKSAEDSARMQARQAAVAERQGGDIAIQKILEKRSSSKGIYGTVASLGVVDTKYALALEVAAGNKLKGIVVDSDKTASDCITFLRENKFGVATFFPLNKVKSRKKETGLDDVAKAKGVVGFAVDLIEFDAQFRTVMSFVFENTLVVESLDVARRIGIGTCKMVTLQGDLAETSGSMRGGFVKTTQGSSSFSEKQTQSEMLKIDAEMQSSQKQVSILEDERQKNDELIVRLRELKSTLEGDIIKMEKSLFINSEDVGVSDQLKKEFREKLVLLQQKERTMQNDVASLTKKLTDLKIERQQLRAQVGDIRNPAKLAELNTFEERMQKLKEQVAALKAQREQLSKQSEQMIAPEVENMERIIKQHTKEIDAFVKQKSDLQTHLASRQKELKELEEKQAAFYKQFKSLLEKRNGLHAKIEQSESKIINHEESIRDVERQNNTLSIEVARITAELAALGEEEKQFGDVALLDERDNDKLKRMIWNDQQKIDTMGNVNMKALDTYEKIEAEYNTLKIKKEKLEEEQQTIMLVMQEIEVKKKEIFLAIFEVLNENFKKLFHSLSWKGDAYLELEFPDDPFAGGAYIKVRISGKKFMDIRSLSGGEKAMTALAFIFAIQEYSPAAYYVLDEVDAALDKRNAERLANLVKRYASKAQFICISHNDGVISEADQLYGVSMDENGMSKVVSLKL